MEIAMNGLIICTSVTALVLTIAGCSEATTKSVEPWPVAGSGNMCLSTSQEVQAEASAVKGDVPSVMRLANHYWVCTDDEAEALRWFRVAAEEGNRDARAAVLTLLLRRNSRASKDEARSLAELWGMLERID